MTDSTHRDTRVQREQWLSLLQPVQALAKAAVLELDPHRLAARLALEGAAFLAAEQAFVGLAIANAVEVRSVVCHGELGHFRLRFDARQGSAGWVLANRQPYLCDNAVLDPNQNDEFVEQFGVRTLLAVPILNHQQHLLGVLQFHNRSDGRPFDEIDLGLAQLMALQVAPALERAQLFSKMHQWAMSLESLISFNAALNRQLDPPALMHDLVAHAARLLNAESGMGGFVDGNRAWVDTLWHQGHRIPFRAEWEAGAGIPGQVWRNESPYLTNQYRTDRNADRRLAEEFGVQNALCVPIIDATKQVIGFFELHNKRDGDMDGARFFSADFISPGFASSTPRFTQDGQASLKVVDFTWADAEFVGAMANTAAIALSNARLLKDLDAQRSQLRALAARQVTLSEDERRRIARELHDEAGQVLIGIKLSLQLLARQIPANLPVLRELANEMRKEINDSTMQLKNIARRLRPPILDQLGLKVAIEQLADDFRARTGIPVAIHTTAVTVRPPELATACYRVVQEALTNIAQHAEATHVEIHLQLVSPNLELIVQDDGIGFDTHRESRRGLGLLGMHERALMLGGKLEIESTHGKGTTVRLTVPIQDDQLG
ncbi:MAG: GAF domain-containing sensor histidine kinase [Caldilineaceae bacterium]|nr:GAF domain-containing sensor histidine kinase [Caldilineaceae bacterium]